MPAGEGERTQRARDPLHVRILPAREPGDPGVAPGGWCRGPHREGRRRDADDARLAEVGQARSTDEGLEQCGAVRCGGGRGKGHGQGEHGRAKRTPDAEPDRRCAQCARPCTTEGTTEQENEVYGALPARHRGSASGRVPLAAKEGRARRRRGDVGAVRREPGDQPPRSPRAAPSRGVPGETVSESVHPQGRRAAAAARRRLAGRQACCDSSRRG